MPAPDQNKNGIHRGYQPLVDRGYQPVQPIGRPDGTAGYQPVIGPANASPKPPTGGSAIQPPPSPVTAKK